MSHPRLLSLLVFLFYLITFTTRAEPGDADAAAAAFHHIENDFGLVPRSESLAALDRFARDHAGDPLAARALVWRSQLALMDGDVAGAGRRYAAVVARYPNSDQAPFAHRGLGDVAMRDDRLEAADREFVLALPGASEVLRSELLEKRRLLATLAARHRQGFFALGVFFLGALWFAVRAARGSGPLRVPPEAIFALPIVVLLAGGARVSDRRVLLALSIAAAGVLAMIGLSGIASERAPPPSRRGLVLHIAVVIVGMAALFYFAAERGGIIDVLKDTFAGTPQ